MVALSVVMPAYNEEAAIKAAVEDVLEHVVSAEPATEVIVVNDGSSDRTGDILANLAAEHPALIVIDQKNAGHGPALMAGLSAANGARLLLLDADRQIDLSDFHKHWAEFRSDDLKGLIGIRRPRQDPFHRLGISAAMRLALLVIYRAAPRDAGVPYKILDADVWSEVSKRISKDCIVPSVLTAQYLVTAHRDRTREIRIVHLPRVGSTSTLNVKKLISFSKTAFLEIMRFRQKMNP